MKSIYIVAIIIIVLVGGGLVALLFEESQAPETSNLDIYTSEEQKSYIEIVDPAGFVNTNNEPITLEQYIGEKVILLDVMTYSCINCQRTFPYVTSWYEKYKDDGLIVIGIHTPEFAFEKDKSNVEEAMKRFGITFPVVLDNEYGTWNAYGNRFWPRKYLIDIHGNIVYDHIGEGAYEKTERIIQVLLEERAEVLGEDGFTAEALSATEISGKKSESRSPETYFGSLRNEYLANKVGNNSGVDKYQLPAEYEVNKLYLGGKWNMSSQYAKSQGATSIVYRYDAKEVYVVARADEGVTVEVWQDGEKVGEMRGEDVSEDDTFEIKESRLYKLIENDVIGEHTLELRVLGEGAEFFAFTFG